MAEKQRLTRAVVEGASAPVTGSTFIWDAEVPGFGLRIHTGKGGVSRAYVYRHFVADPKHPKGGADKWITIGQHGTPFTPDRNGRPRTLTADVARAEALTFRTQRMAGIDPAAQRSERAALTHCITVASFADEYLRRHAPPHLMEASWRKNRELVQRKGTGVLALLGHYRLDEVGPRQMSDVMTALSSTPVNANRMRSLLSHMFTMARTWEFVPAGHVNPCLDIKRFKEQKSERYMSDEEMARLGAVLMAEQRVRPYEVAAILVLALTGARPTEVLSLKRSELDLERGHVMVTRKGRRMPIYLPPGAVAIMRQLKAKPLNPFLFPAIKSNGPMTSTGPVRTIWQRVRERAQLTDVRMYDLRHTLASVAVNDGESLPVIGGLLGHLDQKTTSRYAHVGALTVRAAGNKAAALVTRAMRLPRLAK